MLDGLTEADRIVLRFMARQAAALRDYLRTDPRYLSAEVTAEVLTRQLSLIAGDPDPAG